MRESCTVIHPDMTTSEDIIAVQTGQDFFCNMSITLYNSDKFKLFYEYICILST